MKRTLFFIVVIITVLGCSNDDTTKMAATATSTLPAELVAPRNQATSLVVGQEATFPRATSFKEVVATLRSRAIRGDAQASCQLARELDFCANAEAQEKYLTAMSDRVRAGESGGAISESSRADVLATLADLAKVRGEYCVGAGVIALPERIKYWREAALRGHLPSMLQYGSGLSFKQDELLTALDELKLFKQESAQIMIRAAASGNLQANLFLARAYAPQISGPNLTPLLRQAVQRDAVTSLAYYMVSQQIQQSTNSTKPSALQLQTEADGVKLSMTPEDVALAHAKFQTLRRNLETSGHPDLDPIDQNERASNQPTPGVDFCSRGEFVAITRQH